MSDIKYVVRPNDGITQTGVIDFEYFSTKELAQKALEKHNLQDTHYVKETDMESPDPIEVIGE